MFATRFKELRLKRGLSQAEVSTVFSVSPSTIGMYEQGRRTPDNEGLIKMADYFGVSTDYLLGRVDDPTPQGKPDLVIPEELKGAKVAFHNGDLEDLTQDEVDRLAEFARFIKSQRK